MLLIFSDFLNPIVCHTCFAGLTFRTWMRYRKSSPRWDRRVFGLNCGFNSNLIGFFQPFVKLYT